MRAVWVGVVVSLLSLGASGSQPPAAQSPVLGKISFPTSGSAAAQPSFIRGVLLLHSFEYDDAITAFREAQRIDPAFAMAYWGEAMCFNQTLWENIDLQKGAVALGKMRQAKAPTAREKGYLHAVEVLFGEGPMASRARAYADRMGELSKQFPQDDEAAAFYALALLGTSFASRDVPVMQKAGAIALAILKKNPQHPGAAHYALHAFDDGEHAAMGLEAARIYAKIAPASSHARHMPSHVFLPLGMWDDAAASDEASFAVSVERVKRLGLSMAQADFHSLSWLQYEYLQAGRFSKAREAMATVETSLKAQGSRLKTMEPHRHAESEIGRGFDAPSLESELASMRARLVVDGGVWEEMKGKSAFGNVDELLALGIASVKLGDVARARAAYENLKTARDKAPDATNRQLAQIMMAEVAGLIQLAQGDRATGLRALADAARLEASMPKPIARPYPIKPAQELYGEALLESGDAVNAIAQFQSALARTPRRAAALLGLARAQEKAGRLDDARGTGRAFVAMWRLADSARPELQEARRLAR